MRLGSSQWYASGLLCWLLPWLCPPLLAGPLPLPIKPPSGWACLVRGPACRNEVRGHIRAYWCAHGCMVADQRSVVARRRCSNGSQRSATTCRSSCLVRNVIVSAWATRLSGKNFTAVPQQDTISPRYHCRSSKSTLLWRPGAWISFSPTRASTRVLSESSG